MRERAHNWHPFSYLYWDSCKHKPSELSLTQLFQLLIERPDAQVMTYETTKKLLNICLLKDMERIIWKQYNFHCIFATFEHNI